MNGMLFKDEVDSIIRGLNWLTDGDMPTLEELLITHDFGDTLTFGGVSALTGVDMSGSLGAPAGNSFFSAPGLELGYGMASEFGNFASKNIKGEGTDADTMRLLQQLSPNIGKGWIEDAYTKPGEGPPNPYNKMNPNSSPRTDEDRFVRNFIGGRSTRESRELKSQRGLTQEVKKFRGRKEEIADAIVDRLTKGENWDNLREKYTEKYGGTADELVETVRQRLINRNLVFAERYLGNNPTPDRAKRLEKFRMLIQKADQEELVNNLRELDK
jgi:hypothetical protein